MNLEQARELELETEGCGGICEACQYSFICDKELMKRFKQKNIEGSFNYGDSTTYRCD